jgi:ppGpp synthetase/RelA/SpoT-type nucleotidyltranferase
MNKGSKFTLEKAVKELFGEKFPVEGAIGFIKEKIENHRYLSAGIIKQLNSIILEYQNRTYEKEKRTSVYLEPESKYQIKTPESIIEKMWRSKRGHRKGVEEKLKYTADNFLETMEDIIRFRILCNYLCDADRITGILPGQMTRLKYENNRRTQRLYQ